MPKLALVILLAALIAAKQTSQTPAEVASKCQFKQKMEVLPGRGWDNLRNKEMGQVFQFTYDQCKTTEDGEYLLPDHVSVIPIKQSDVELTSEIFGHYMNYTSITTRGFQTSASGTFKSGFGIGGSFSDEYRNAKSHQFEEKAVTTRVQLRNTAYSVIIEPSAQIEPSLKKLLMDAIHELDNKNTEKAQLMMELVVRDYGTHYLSYVDAGAVLYEEDYIKRSWTQDSSVKTNEISAAASANFLTFFNFDIKYHQTVDSKTVEGFQKSKTSSFIHSLGGAIFEPNMTVHEWVSKIPNNLVTVDRAGELLSFILIPQKFDNVSLSSLGRLRTSLEEAIDDYYNFNSHTGCVSMDSPNFDYSANVDDGSCKSPSNNYTFGGVFQTCILQQSGAGDICASSFNQKNPLTGGYSCPPGYEQIPLVAGTKVSGYDTRECHEECRGWWWWKECDQVCPTVHHQSAARYSSYWCAVLKGPVAPNTGMMFGGLYTSSTKNPMTKSTSCPPTYVPLRAGEELMVCVSNDYELGFKYSVSFGGFFSCYQGNAIVTGTRSPGSKAYTNPKDPYPHACPPGYSQHMADIDDNCEVNYCVVANAFGINGQIPVHRPPFRSLQAMYSRTTLMLSVVAARPFAEEKLSGGAIAGVVVACAAVLVLAVALVYVYRQRRQMKNTEYIARPAQDQERLVNDEGDGSQYGTIVNDDDPTLSEV